MEDHPATATQNASPESANLENLKITTRAIGGLHDAFTAIVEGAELPENAPRRPTLLQHARQVYYIAEGLDSGDPA